MRWMSKITVPHVGLVLQGITVSIVVLSAVIAFSNWQAEASKRQTDATLRYFDKLIDRDYIRYLREIEGFTLCFERAAKRHLSYTRFSDINGKDDAYALGTGWWDLVENDNKELEECGKPPNIEEKLIVIYGRLEALASCARQKLCSYSRIVDMMEAFDHLAVLSISNYLLLTREHERRISRGWTMHGALVDLVEIIEKHMFESPSSAMAHAADLDSKRLAPDNQPLFKPAAVDAIRNKRTRCDPPAEAASGEWRRCGLTQK